MDFFFCQPIEISCQQSILIIRNSITILASMILSPGGLLVRQLDDSGSLSTFVRLVLKRHLKQTVWTFSTIAAAIVSDQGCDSVKYERKAWVFLPPGVLMLNYLFKFGIVKMSFGTKYQWNKNNWVDRFVSYFSSMLELLAGYDRCPGGSVIQALTRPRTAGLQHESYLSALRAFPEPHALIAGSWAVCIVAYLLLSLW